MAETIISAAGEIQALSDLKMATSAMAARSLCSKPHVMMLPYPLQGHITPLMQLSKLLAARGFVITFVTTEFNVGKMMKAKQGLMAGKLAGLGIKLVGISDGLPNTHPRDSSGDPVAFVASLFAQQAAFEELVGRMMTQEQVVITCIISDSFLLWSQDVANKWGIPRISFWPQSLTTFACSISVPNIMAAHPHLDPFKDEVYRSTESKVINCIPGLSGIEACQLPFFTLGGELSADWMRHHVGVQMERINEPLCIVCNTFADLERDVFTHLKELPLSKPMFTLGPLLPSTFLGGQEHTDDNGIGCSLFDEDEECLRWLDGQAPCSVLYISLGSYVVLDKQDVLEVAMGLEACNVPFLWVIRSLDYDLSLVISKKQGKVVHWAPQLRVLSHGAVGGFFTHCGWNSTLESISLGVPVIGWPQMMDQITNCWLQVEKLKVGLRLDLDASNKIRHIDVEKAVRTLMQEEEGHQMRTNASKFLISVRKAYKTSLVSNLDSLTLSILSSHKGLCSS